MISRILTGLTVIILISACHGAGMKSTITSERDPAWFIGEDMSNVGIIVLDYQTLRLKRAYLSVQTPCNDVNGPVSDEELKFRASGLFNAVEKGLPRRIVVDEECKNEELALKVTHKGDLAVLEIEPGDIGGFAVSHQCSGLVVFAGSIIWSGTGQQLYPAIPIRTDALKDTFHRPPPPEQIDVVMGPYALGSEEDGIAAWNAIQKLNFVQDLAQASYSVLVYLYPRSVGVFSPSNAEWVIFVHRYPDWERERRPAPTSPPQQNQQSPTPTTLSPSSPLPISPLKTPTP